VWGGVLPFCLLLLVFVMSLAPLLLAFYTNLLSRVVQSILAQRVALDQLLVWGVYVNLVAGGYTLGMWYLEKRWARKWRTRNEIEASRCDEPWD
jgi:hypothetical protein